MGRRLATKVRPGIGPNAGPGSAEFDRAAKKNGPSATAIRKRPPRNKECERVTWVSAPHLEAEEARPDECRGLDFRLLLTVADAAAHAALLAPNLPTSLTSSTTGHAFSSYSDGKLPSESDRGASDPPGGDQRLNSIPSTPQTSSPRRGWQRGGRLRSWGRPYFFRAFQLTFEKLARASMSECVPLRS